MATYQQGALKQGSNPSEYGNDVGYAVFSRSATLQASLTATGAANYDVTIPIPSGCSILAIYADSSVAWTASGTVGVTVGVTAGGTEYVTSFDAKTITRGPTAAFSAAQLGALAAPASTNVVARAAVSAASGTYVGTTKVTILYAPTL